MGLTRKACTRKKEKHMARLGGPYVFVDYFHAPSRPRYSFVILPIPQPLTL